MFPWVVTWDDHEVDNNYAGDVAEDKQTRAELLERRANAYQAYYENMPLRAAALPKGSAMLLYRTVDFGDLARFAVLDTRQYRTDQPCGDGNKGGCREAFDPNATILGAAQREWLFGTLGASRARWNVVAQQVLMAKIDTKAGEEEAYSMDQWSGYEADRKRVLDFFAQRKPSNPIVITGDIHSNWVADLKMDWRDERSATVGTEFVGTSISSGGDGAEERPTTQAQYRENPHLKWFNGQRGYVKCTVTPAEYRADYRVVPYVTRPGAPVATRSSWTVESGRTGVKKG
jgi:alkaline phosphatase D